MRNSASAVRIRDAVRPRLAVSRSDIVMHLIDKDLLDPSAVVSSRFTLRDISRRNCNLAITLERGPSYFVKAGVGGGQTLLAREALAYELLLAARNTLLTSALPDFHGYDAAWDLLVLELLPESVDLVTYNTSRARFPIGIAVQLGSVLANLHRLGADSTGELPTALASSPAGPPGGLSLHRPHKDTLERISWAGRSLIELVQGNAALCQALDDVRSGWTQNAFVHGDIRWTNCLVRRSPRRGPELKLVDWEFCGRGDPWWDVGCVFAEYLVLWVLSIPVIGQGSPDQFLPLARYPLARMQRSIRAYWEAYCRLSHLLSRETDRYLERALRYSAARLLQRATELLRTSNELSTNAVCMVQVGANILRDPGLAAERLFGLTVGPPSRDTKP
jgi:hypothetical protein